MTRLNIEFQENVDKRDLEIKTLYTRLQTELTEYETFRNESSLRIKELEKIEREHQSKILELDERIAKKEDVEQQLAAVRAHNEEIWNSKEEL